MDQIHTFLAGVFVGFVAFYLLILWVVARKKD